MIVEIISSRPSYWYHGKEGERYSVKVEPENGNYILSNDSIRVIKVEDARVIEDQSAIKPVQLTIIAPGSPARIGKVPVLVTQAHVEIGQVEYTVAWWMDGQRHSDRVPEYEIDEAESTIKVGFKDHD